MDLDRLGELLAAGRVLVLTGAGVSTDSGIPDYRGPGAPVRAPMTFSEFVHSAEARQRYWARAHVGWSRMGSAAPNATHLRLVELDRAGILAGLVTQNVDGLHSKAGHPGVIDLHGRVDRVICLDCSQVVPRAHHERRLADRNPGWTERTGLFAPDGDVVLEETADFVVAACEACGGRLKPDVVFFGESVAKPLVAHCFALTEAASAVVVLGSSLQVMSGLRFVRRAASLGIPVAIVNRGPTRGDDLADVRIDAGCAETLLSVAGATLAP
ncbi:transcriptional regulator, Sir2 family [Aeromicrobium marinum DSM 15272]|uniref:NAD-dependent protein deacetylase n=1 Tax=Aeromicrobium marinum DSM 15272 TaxID=585531 RepID=E2S8I5_9ACTN|nr:NAD-dependent protein deacetylase [Aeromicrobium marinum]EFQ84490.1 transcriptional regulator, Sir2 family [Aeromicrobium marinum DSM 15272]